MGYALRRQTLTIVHCSLSLQILAIFANGSWILVPELVIRHAWCLHFGALEDPGAILGHWEHKKGHFEVQAWIYTVFFLDLGTPFYCVLLKHLGPKKCILSWLLPGFFF